jgi:poly(A) polymerase
VKKIIQALSSTGSSFFLRSYSALDKLLRVESTPEVYTAAQATLIDLAKEFPDIEYPGYRNADAEIVLPGTLVRVLCIDGIEEIDPGPYAQQNLFYDVSGGKFLDPYDRYPSVRGDALVFHDPRGIEAYAGWRLVGDAAVLAGRYGYGIPDDLIGSLETRDLDWNPLGTDDQRELLQNLITGGQAERGLALLMETGFVDKHWPELAALNRIEQNKEFHPEGNVWAHSLAALSYRKTRDLDLGLGLLLHDIGKPEAPKAEGKKFLRHAQIGSRTAERFLRRLDFPESTASRVRFLVENHMLPSGLGSLPVYKTEEAMSSPLFPLVLELNRCDVSAGFHGLDDYYTACKAYRRFLKNKKNPFRDTAGKKLLRMYVEG